MITNDIISLRAVEPEDLDFLYKIENEPSMWIHSARKEPYSRYAIRQYIEHCDRSVFERGQLRFIITAGGETVGTIDIFEFDYNNRKSEFGIFIAPDYRKRNYAVQAIALLSEYCKTFLGLHQLYGMVETNNTASLRTLVKSGFSHKATLKDWLFFDSRYYDVDVLQKIL